MFCSISIKSLYALWDLASSCSITSPRPRPRDSWGDPGGAGRGVKNPHPTPQEKFPVAYSSPGQPDHRKEARRTVPPPHQEAWQSRLQKSMRPDRWGFCTVIRATAPSSLDLRYSLKDTGEDGSVPVTHVRYSTQREHHHTVTLQFKQPAIWRAMVKLRDVLPLRFPGGSTEVWTPGWLTRVWVSEAPTEKTDANLPRKRGPPSHHIPLVS